MQKFLYNHHQQQQISRDRHLFKQYFSGKYSVKRCNLADRNGYSSNFCHLYWKVISYSWSRTCPNIRQEFMKKYFEMLSNCMQQVTSSSPVFLLRNYTYLIGTFRSNCTELRNKSVEQELEHGEVCGLHRKDGIKLINSRDKRKVLMIFKSCTKL